MVSQKSHATGRFTFTAAESGQHRLCFQASDVGGGWFSSSLVRLQLDITFGDAGEINKAPGAERDALAQRVRDLIVRLEDIRREQVFQRVCLMPYLRG